MMRLQEQDTKALNDLSNLILNIIRPSSSVQTRSQPLTPSGFAAMMMGVSTALMLCGSVTFLLGFLLMPWVLGLVMVVYVVGVFSSFMMIWRAVLCSCGFSVSALDSIKNEASAWKFL